MWGCDICKRISRFCLTIVLVAIGFNNAFAAVAIDATTSAGKISGSSLTVSHTTSGSNRLMLVGFSIEDNENRRVSSMTYNGVAMTLVGSREISGKPHMEIWKLVNPPAGTHNVIVNLTGLQEKGMVAGVMTFTGVDQTTPLGTFASATGEDTQANVNVSAAVGDLVFATVMRWHNPLGNVGPGDTQQWHMIYDKTHGGGSTEIATSTTVNMSWSGTEHQWAMGGVAVKPVNDIAAPAVVSNLATSNPQLNSIDLAWTAPGDDNNDVGTTATTYDIRYRTDAAITDSNWATATQVTGEPSPSVQGTSESMTVSGLSSGTTYYFAIKSEDEIPNISVISNSPSGTTLDPPVGGYSVNDVIPAGQISQATDGSGIITINWKARDDQSDNVSLHTFQYSDDGGATWYTPNNGDVSGALSVNWDDNGGAGWSTATTFAAATAHSFSFNSQHADVTAIQSLDNTDQSDIQFRFTVNDGSVDSVNPVTSESAQVDNLAPNDTIVSGIYDPDTDTLVITGTNFTSIAPVSTDIKSYVDWTRFIWDINGDDAVTANITFVLGDVSSLTITNATTLTLVVSAAKGTAIEASAGYGAAGGADTLDVTAGFSIDALGNVATTDGVSDGPLAITNNPPVGGYTADDVIPAGQISQATDGSGVITINWKARDNQADNVSLNTFQYSDDGGSTWFTPNNGDVSGALSVNWNDNGGGGWSTATTFAAATAHSFSFNSQHADVSAIQSLDNADQSDIQFRFTVNDGSVDSVNPATSESVQVDNLAPNATIVSGAYNSDADTLVLTGTNFTSIAPASTDIKDNVDWSKLVWDINGDDAVTANITFALGDVSSLTITNATTLTLVVTAAKGTAIEANAGYGAAGGADTLDVTAGFSIDAFGNVATTDGVSDGPLDFSAPVGGYTADDVIPASQISQATDGSGIITINWKARDNQADNVSLNTFQYSDDGGATWYTPNNGDVSGALSANWDDNGGGGWSTATTFAAATAHSFTFNTQHADVTAVQSLDNLDQSDIQIRFIVNDGSADSVNPATSGSVQVDNLDPNDTIVSGGYNADTNTLVLTGTNFTSIAAASTDIKSFVDWSKFVWDINGDDAVTANITFVLGDISSLTVTNATTLTLVFAGAKAAVIEAAAGYGAAGGADTLDVSVGFSIDAFGNAATTDVLSNGALAVNNAPFGGFSVDDIIPAGQISQATDGSGVISINWKARDDQSDNVSLHTFQYSDDGGATWYTPNNGDVSGALSANWDDNGGGGWLTATTFAAATAHSFTFNSQHTDVTAVQSLDNLDQSNIQVRFTVNDGNVDSANPVTSESVQVDNLAPNDTIVSGIYDPDTDTLVITGTNFISIAPVSTDIKSYVDWTRFIWDINGDDAGTANFSFALGDVNSLTITNATTLTLVLAGAKAAAIEAAPGYGVVGGGDTLDIAAGFSVDVFGNVATSDGVSDGPLSMSNTPPVGGFSVDDVIPADQISQANDGSGVMNIIWKARDNELDNVTLNTFQYSDDGGATWYTPNNGDTSGALSANWDDDGGSGWSTATSFGAATVHIFTFNTQHADVVAVQSLGNIDQSDIQVRFIVNDGTVNSTNPTTSVSVRVDNFAPNNTIVSSAYNATSNTLTLTGTNFSSIAPVNSDIKALVDWSKFVWDINGDDAVTANITFVLGDIGSLTIVDATTLALAYTDAKAAAIEATIGYGGTGGADTIDVSTGFSIDAFGNVSTTDGVSDAPLDLAAPVGGYTADDVIPASQVSQATDGSGIITINWKARDDQSDNVSLHTFQYSDDGGSTWFTPNNGDISAALSFNWDDNGGSGWSTASTFGAATAHNFTFNTQHADVTAVQSLDNLDQSDIQVRFIINDGSADSINPATSESVQVDNFAPNNTIVSATYNSDVDTLVITGTNFTSIAPASTDIKSFVDWTKFVWDINSDDAVSADISVVVGDVTSLTVANATTLTLVFTAAKGAAIEATAGYGAAGGADSLDITAGFSIDAVGNVSNSDSVNDGLIANPSISGMVFSDDDEVTPLVGETVRLLINGVDSGLTDVTDASGNYRIEATPNPGDLLLVYFDSGGGNQGTTVSVSNGLSLAGANVYQNHIVVRHDNAGVMSNAILNSATNGDADIQYAVVGGGLTVSGANELYIASGHSYSPGGDVTTPSMESRGDFDGGANAIDINGALSIVAGNFITTSTTISIEGNYALSGGTFDHNDGTVVFDGGNQSLTGSTTFNNLSKTDTANDATDVLLTFDNNATQTIIGTLTLAGLDDDDRINLVSSNPGNQWSINLAASATKVIDFVDVTDSDASGSDATQISVNPANSVSSGNNVQWFSGAVSSVLAEIDRVSITASSVGNNFNYDVLSTISADDTGINSVAITAPAGFTNLVVNTMFVGNTEQVNNCPVPGADQYCAAITGQVMTMILGSKITETGSNVNVQFTADAPAVVGSASFTATVDDTDTAQAEPQTVTAGDADGDADDANSQTVNVIPFNGLDGSTVVADPLIVTANGIASSTLTATLLDNSSVAVPGKNIIFSSDRGGVDVVTQPVTFSDVNGVAVGSIRSTTPGAVTITATDTTNGITLNEQPQLYFSQGLVLDLTKTANKDEVLVGDIVTYQIEIKNTTNNDINPVTLEDSIPPNFKYLKGSARMYGAPFADPSGNRLLLFDIGTVPALVDTNGNGEADPQEQGHLLLSYQLVVGAGATPGDYVNTVQAWDVCDACSISNTVSESVEVVLDPFFDLGTIIGKVFNDKNEDGWQDKGETGIAGAMVALDDGTYVLTDSHGRYHFPAVQPGQRLLKINSQSLPSGSRFSTPITQVLSVTPGLLVKANFGVRHPSEHRKIGREGELSANITRKELSESTVDIYGSVAMQKLFVNGTEVPVAKVDVNMYTNTPAQDLLNFTDGILKETVGFKPTTNRNQGETKSWELQILTAEGDVVRSFKADGILPSTIPWDGLVEDNTPLEGGRDYHYQLSVEFWDKNRAMSPRRLFSVNERSALKVNMTGNTFELGSTTLSATAKDFLKNIADALRKYPDGKIFIDGHTDTLGSSISNMALSKARAEAAARYLVQIEGIPRARLHVRGFGETQPVASNNEPEQHSINRRIELHGNISKRALAKSYRRFTVEPTLSINGEKIEIDKYFTFRDTMVLAEAENLAITMTDRFGRSSLSHLYAPKLQLPNQGEEESYRIVFPPKSDQSSGVAISEYHFEGTTMPGSVVEFDGEPVQVADDGTFRHKIGLPAGKSTHNLIVTAPSGYTRFSSFELTAVNHDEAGRPLYLVEPVPFLELDVPREGARVNSKLYTVSGKTAPNNAVFVNDEEIGVEVDGSFSHTLNLISGHNLISVRTANPEGFEGSVEHGVEVSDSELFLMAFADGKFGKLEAEGYLEGTGMQSNKEYYNEGRVAYYLKGRIKGKYLITSAFDSGTQKIDKLLDGLDEQDNSKLFTQLDPDKLYPVYGDSSTLVNDIESQGKFYLAVESDELDIVVGNYAVDFNDTELAGFQRTLYGARASYQSLSSTMIGRPDTKLIMFGAQVKQAPIHDELRATGGSLYYLSHSDIIEGSEQVTLVTRDKDTGLTLNRVTLQRNIDYRIYYDQGRLISNDPISSVVEDQSLFDSSILSGNPVSLEVNYEAELNSFEKKVLGARVSKTLNENIAIGATQINDELNEGEYELSSVDAELRLGRAVRVLAELAESSGIDSQTYLSEDGGLTFNNVTPSGELNGNAWKATVEMDVGELLGDPGRMFVDAYLKLLSDGFLSMGNFLERGTRKAGINMLYSLSSQSKLLASYTTEESDVDLSNQEAIAETANLSLQWRFDAARWGVTTEYQGRDMKDASGNELESNQYTTGQLRYQLTEKVTTHLERQQTISGIENDQTTLGADYQVTESTKMTGSLAQGTQGKAAKAGIQWLFDGGKIYLNERLTQNKYGQSALSTVVGGESQLGSNTRIFSEYQIESADAGDKQISLLGADRFWQLQKGLLFTLAGEHSLINGVLSDRERYTLSTSLSYKGQSGLSWSTKNEFRREQGDEKLLQYLSNFLIEQKLNPDYTLLFKYQLSQTRNQDLDTIEADFNEHSIGLAYRPVASDRLNLLARYTGISDKRPLNLGQHDSQEIQTDIFSIEWSYDLTRRLEWVDKLAIKVKTEEFGGHAPFTSHTGLSIHRLNYQFAEAWDLGAEYRILAQREADDQRTGWLTELMWRANDHMRLGVGYNFTDFSDNEYSDNNYSVKGAFVRLQGMY